MKNNKIIYAWACDIENYRGEGILGINFLKQLSHTSNKRIFVESPTTILLINKNKIKLIKTVSKTKINFGIFSNYFNPFYGVVKILLCKFSSVVEFLSFLVFTKKNNFRTNYWKCL